MSVFSPTADTVVVADSLTEDECSSDALIFACLRGDESTALKLLQDHHRDRFINNKGIFGKAPIHVACEQGHLPIVRLLVQYGANMENFTKCGVSPLEIAISGNYMNIVKFLFTELKATDPAVLDDTTRSPVHYAAILTRNRIIKWLLKNGADPNAVMPGGKTPAHLVCAHQGSSQAVQCLYELIGGGADFSLYDDEGKLPIHVAQSVKILEALINVLDMDVDMRDRQGWTPFHHVCAAVTGREEVFRFLLDNHADINALTDDGDAPIHLAMRHGGTMSSLLLQHEDVDFTVKNALGRNCLHLVFVFHRTEKYILHFLKQHYIPSGADINQATGSGWTALHYAVFYNLFDVQKFLVEQGASMSQYNAAGQSPLHMIGTKNFSLTVGQEEVALQEALDGRIGTQRKFPLRDPFPLPVNYMEAPKVRRSMVPWPAQHQGVYEHLLNRGTDCLQRDEEGNLPFFLAAATDWLDATFSMLRVAASQGLFGPTRIGNQPKEDSIRKRKANQI